jgi:hypothetical protein
MIRLRVVTIVPVRFFPVFYDSYYHYFGIGGGLEIVGLASIVFGDGIIVLSLGASLGRAGFVFGAPFTAGPALEPPRVLLKKSPLVPEPAVDPN